MRRLKILVWHVHGSYLNALTRAEHDWYVPVKRGSPAGYGGRGRTFDLPAYVREVPAEHVRDLHHLDAIVFQSPKNYLEDQYEILSAAQRQLPQIYLEHDAPRQHPTDTRHPVDDPTVLLVHVTRFNRLMWDNGRTPSVVIEHSVAIDRDIAYRGRIDQGVTVANNIQHRGRLAGYDLFEQIRRHVPTEAIGMGTEAFGGLGDIPYRHLHRHVAEYRYLFNPMRYTSLSLSMIEAMTIGMPVVGLTTTELPSVIENGVHGYLSCDVDELTQAMHQLIRDPELARRLGANARAVARERFGLDRFIRDWNRAFDEALSLRSVGMRPYAPPPVRAAADTTRAP